MASVEKKGLKMIWSEIENEVSQMLSGRTFPGN